MLAEADYFLWSGCEGSQCHGQGGSIAGARSGNKAIAGGGQKAIQEMRFRPVKASLPVNLQGFPLLGPGS